MNEIRSDKGSKEICKKLLFNFQDIKRYLEKESIRKRSPKVPETWGCSSAGRAPALHAGGQEFDPPHLHQRDEVE